ncbi:putative serine proteinase, subtilase family [Thermogutta terrifontis]|uniref:Putative serine proteinase, subtilase family n=1 Tax=Thermogutta terrifontis TaxID=1331910 RepID=A0A286RKM5_9BACT|nr:PPC domain-containing protein [Thermogutta terrifontis]ASV76521.1 putative serine proteinase, subtilase family [Thermogutta terrifontis]
MKKKCLPFFLAVLIAILTEHIALPQPYIGYVYPAGAQQGTTVQVRLGGQRLAIPQGAIVSGKGVEAKLVEYRWYLNNQEVAVMQEQLRILENQAKEKEKAGQKIDEATQRMMDRLRERIAEWQNFPANRSIVDLAIVEIKVAPDADPGPREIRLVTTQGPTNPVVFYVSQFPEVVRKPLKSCPKPILGNEQAAEIRRPPEEKEVKVSIPCVVNGQIAPGFVDAYRFEAKKGQRLVIKASTRELIPYIADAVPGWFQAVLTLYDANGREVAFSDSFRFDPDPVIYYEVPEDGEYVLTISDALFRGREDFVYRVSIAEAPFITHIFPLGSQVGQPVSLEVKGWNTEGAQVEMPPQDAGPGIHFVRAVRNGLVSNRVPFARDTLPEVMEKEPNNQPDQAQPVSLPAIINGRIDQPGDWDVFRVEGKAGQTLVAEVMARRLNSPLDSLLRITDASGKLLAINDDYEDPGMGQMTYHADSYIMFQLPADGTYLVYLGDTTRHGGEEYAYRLRLSEPRPDFALRVIPSALAIRSQSTAALRVYAIRKDGFEGDIQVSLKDPPEGFANSPVILRANQEMVSLGVKTTLKDSNGAVPLTVIGKAKIGDQEIVHEAVAAEDKMQAFLWRHLLPVGDLVAQVYDPSYQPQPKRTPPQVPPELVEAARKAIKEAGRAPFSKSQVAGRVRMLNVLYENEFLTDEFYLAKMAECAAAEE